LEPLEDYERLHLYDSSTWDPPVIDEIQFEDYIQTLHGTFSFEGALFEAGVTHDSNPILHE